MLAFWSICCRLETDAGMCCSFDFLHVSASHHIHKPTLFFDFQFSKRFMFLMIFRFFEKIPFGVRGTSKGYHMMGSEWILKKMFQNPMPSRSIFGPLAEIGRPLAEIGRWVIR